MGKLRCGRVEYKFPRVGACDSSSSTSITMSGTTSTLEPLFTFVTSSYAALETNFFKIPGSAVVARYVKSSHQNDPGRTLLEVILIIFAVRTLLQSRTRADHSGKHFIQFDEKVNSLTVIQSVTRLTRHNRKLTTSLTNGLLSHWHNLLHSRRRPISHALQLSLVPMVPSQN